MPPTRAQGERGSAGYRTSSHLGARAGGREVDEDADDDRRRRRFVGGETPPHAVRPAGPVPRRDPDEGDDRGPPSAAEDDDALISQRPELGPVAIADRKLLHQAIMVARPGQTVAEWEAAAREALAFESPAERGLAVTVARERLLPV